MHGLDLIGFVSPDATFATSPTSSQDTDFGGFGLTDEELSDLWQAAVQSSGPSSFDLNDYAGLIDPSGFSVPLSDEDNREQTGSTGFSYPIDPQGRRGSSYF
jgi:hypothetical protein